MQDRAHSAFVVDLAPLRRQGIDRHRVELELSPPWLVRVLEGTDAEVAAAGSAALDLVLQADGSVVATGKLRATFDVPCGRCLDPASVDASCDLAALFVRGSDPRAARADDDAFEVDDESDDGLDVLRFDGTLLDLEPWLAEYVKLGYPMRALCARGEACRGLCTGCGAALDEQPPGERCTACGLELPREGSEGAPVESALARALSRLKVPEG
jgi:uncharacterized metal-binding protein YceD (DUF177 family)